MKKLIIILALILCSCSEDEDGGIDCSLVDVAYPSLNVKIVDSTGENLIENGSINPDHIEVEGNFDNADFLFVPEDEFSSPELHNSLSLFIPFQSQFQYILHLDDLDSVTIDFSAELIEAPCVNFFKPTNAFIDGVEVDLQEEVTLQFLVVVEI
jgi:hypothetical protein